MTSALKICILCSLLLGTTVTRISEADVKGRVRVSVTAQDEFWVGQQIEVNLDLLTTGYSFSDSRFNLPEIPGVLLLQIDSTTIKLNENSNGERWQVIRYPLALFSQKGGPITIPPIKVRFSSAEVFGKEVRDFDLQTESLVILTSMPPGATANALVLSTSDFEVNFQWSPSAADEAPIPARIGDAVTLKITRQASDISGMLLSPLPVFSIAGIEAYPEAPLINDRVNRGSLTGERTDTTTWILEQPGEYEWPDLSIQWWDPLKQQLKQKQVDGLKLSVSASPAAATPVAINTSGGQLIPWQQLLIVMIALLTASFLVWKFGGRITAPIVRWAQAYASSPAVLEKAAFRVARAACRDNQAPVAYALIYRWLECFVPGCSIVQEFPKLASDEIFVGQMTELQRNIVDRDETWNGRNLSVSLARVRRVLRSAHQDRAIKILPTLNP